MTAEKTILKCRHCSKEFKYDSERRRHEQSHFPQFQCKVCNKNFSFISALRRHEKQHERTGSVQCNKCGRQFRDNILLKRHIKYAHGGTYSCEKCNATLSSETALSMHMKTHKSESERKYQCSFNGCSKKFNFAHHLKHHELTHTNTKQHFCNICDKGFIQSHHLKTHMKTHNTDSSLYCSFPNCTKKFATEYAKKRHMAKHHVKIDSGISSDSNSTHDGSFVKTEIDSDTISCSICGQVLFKINYENHTLNCVGNSNEELITGTPAMTANDTNNSGEHFLVTPDKNYDDELRNCKTVLGSCIMDDKGEKCVCEQISKTTENDFDFTPIDNEPINMCMGNNNNSCEGCECSDRCSIRNGISRDVMPEIEYKTDGTVKIKDTFDMDISLVENIHISPKNEVKFLPYNSCKDVLGNCIVSGNATMGEGCLCAKMILDDRVTAQEIEDITPHPNGNCD